VPSQHSSDLPLDALDERELEATVRVVRALVDRDRTVLESIGAYEGGADPYVWTENYGRWGRVELMVPPGDPKAWSGSVIRRDDDRWIGVCVDMWTRQEGRSDLTLELDLTRGRSGTVPSPRFVGLHVM
jgi:hypothetical protein